MSRRTGKILPFFMINVLAGFTRVRLGTFIWTTSRGILPATAVVAFAGEQVDRLRPPQQPAKGVSDREAPWTKKGR